MANPAAATFTMDSRASEKIAEELVRKYATNLSDVSTMPAASDADAARASILGTYRNNLCIRGGYRGTRRWQVQVVMFLPAAHGRMTFTATVCCPLSRYAGGGLGWPDENGHSHFIPVLLRVRTQVFAARTL